MSERQHIKGFNKSKYNYATVGRLSNITDRAYNKCKYKYATVGRLSDITDRALKEIPPSDVWATSQKGLITKVNNRSATVGRLSDIADRACNKCK